MRGSWWHRALAALLAVWFGVFVAEPAWLHACAVHSPSGGGGHGASHHAAASAHPAAHPAAHQTPHQSVHHAPSTDQQPTPHQCTCPGACCAVTPPALPAVAEHPVVEALVAAIDRGRPEHEYVAAWVDFVLPFANAPPSPALLA